MTLLNLTHEELREILAELTALRGCFPEIAPALRRMEDAYQHAFAEPIPPLPTLADQIAELISKD